MYSQSLSSFCSALISVINFSYLYKRHGNGITTYALETSHRVFKCIKSILIIVKWVAFFSLFCTKDIGFLA